MLHIVSFNIVGKVWMFTVFMKTEMVLMGHSEKQLIAVYEWAIYTKSSVRFTPLSIC